MFQVTTLDLAKLAARSGAQIDFGQDFFGKRAGLTVSGQLEAEIFAPRLPTSTRSARPSAPRTPTRRATWPSSG